MRVFNFILSHSIFVAFCAIALAYQTVLLLHLSASIYLYGFIFFATLCSYNFYWLLSKYSFRHDIPLTDFFKKEADEIVLLCLSVAGLLLCFVNVHLSYYVIIAAAALTGLYAIPLLPISFLKFTRKAGVLKTTLLAFTWSFVTVFIPLQKASFILTDLEFFILTRRFLFMLMLCIIFDNRDIAVDKIRGLRSLATDLSVKTMRYLIYSIFIILFATNFLFRYYGVSIAQSIALQISTIALLITYYYSTKKQGYLFYYFFVDGMMLFSAAATWVASI